MSKIDDAFVAWRNDFYGDGGDHLNNGGDFHGELIGWRACAAWCVGQCKDQLKAYARDPLAGGAILACIAAITPKDNQGKDKAMSEEKCKKCDGCGQIANDQDGSPWSRWESIPEEAKLAVAIGLVYPIPCPACNGTGKVEGQ